MASDPVTEAVRRACEATACILNGCQWPSCACHITKDVLATLITQARAEGAREEREACAKLDCNEALRLALRETVGKTGRHIAAAIPNRITGDET